MDCRVNPSVFKTATSRVRSRIDMAMVVAETSKVANTTAKQILRIKAFTLPMLLMKLNWNAFSLSVFVGSGEFRNMASTADATEETLFGESARMANVPAFPLANA